MKEIVIKEEWLIAIDGLSERARSTILSLIVQYARTRECNPNKKMTKTVKAIFMLIKSQMDERFRAQDYGKMAIAAKEEKAKKEVAPEPVQEKAAPAPPTEEKKEVKPKGKTMEEKKTDLADRTKKFEEEVMSYRQSYSEQMLRAFYDYWSEPNKAMRMKWESEKTWDLSRRLARWERMDYGRSSPSRRDVTDIRYTSGDVSSIYSNPNVEKNEFGWPKR